MDVRVKRWLFEKLGTLYPILIAIMLSLLVITPYYIGRLAVSKNDVKNYAVADDDDFIFELENITKDREGRIVAIGWLIDSNPFYEYYNYGSDVTGNGTYNYIHVGVIKGNEIIEFPTKLRERKDVDYKYDDGKWHGHCGFMAYIPQKYLSDELVITSKKYKGKSYVIRLGVYADEYIK